MNVFSVEIIVDISNRTGLAEMHACMNLQNCNF